MGATQKRFFYKSPIKKGLLQNEWFIPFYNNPLSIYNSLILHWGNFYVKIAIKQSYYSTCDDAADKFFTRSATTWIPLYCSCNDTLDFSVSCAVLVETSLILSTASTIE